MSEIVQPEATLLYFFEKGSDPISRPRCLLSIGEGEFESIGDLDQQTHRKHPLLSYIKFIAEGLDHDSAKGMDGEAYADAMNFLRTARMRTIILFLENRYFTDGECRKLIQFTLGNEGGEVICVGAGQIIGDDFVHGIDRFLSPNSTLDIYRIPDKETIKQEIRQSDKIATEQLAGYLSPDELEELSDEEDEQDLEDLSQKEIKMAEETWTRIYSIIGNNPEQIEKLHSLLPRSSNGAPDPTFVNIPSDFIEENRLATFGDLETLLAEKIGPETMSRLPESFKNSLRRAPSGSY